MYRNEFPSVWSSLSITNVIDVSSSLPASVASWNKIMIPTEKYNELTNLFWMAER